MWLGVAIGPYLFIDLISKKFLKSIDDVNFAYFDFGWSLLTWYKNNKMEFEEENQFQFQMPQKNSVIF